MVKKYISKKFPNSYSLKTALIVLIIASSLSKNVISASSSGAASSVFSNRNSKSSRNDNQNSNSNSANQEWIYEMTLNESNFESQPIPDEQLLISKLLRNYDPASRPVYNASTPVVIYFGFALIQICDMDERNQILTTNVWLEQEWKDERLIWNKSEYNNLDKIRLPCNRLWLPDIVLYNSADDYTEGYMQSKAMVTNEGVVFWPPPVKLRSSCKIDVTFFPFDDQICHLKFGSWTYSGLQVNVMNKSTTVDLSNYIKSGEWDLRNVYVQRNVQYYPCCPGEPYPDIFFYIYIRRRILYYLFNIIFPCVWLSILSLVGFWLPPDSGEKITLGITVLLAFSVFMLLIAENIPATSEMVPLIGIYLTVIMSLTSMSIILTVIVLHLHHSGPFPPKMPNKFYNFMTKKVAYWVCMNGTVLLYERNRKKSNRNLEKEDNENITSVNIKSNEKKKRVNRNVCCCCKTNDEIHNFSNSKSGIILLENGRLENLYETKLNELNNKKVKNKLLNSKQKANSTDSDDYFEIIKNRFDSKELQKTKSPLIKISTDKLNDQNQNMYKCKCNLCQTKELNNKKRKYKKDLIETIELFSNNLKDYLSKDYGQTNNTNEWKLIALIIDRVLFWIFTFLTVVSTLILLVVIPVLKNRNILNAYKYDGEIKNFVENF
ncbi:unnamed protein product [Brachionus calyciflorus]|uniref:Uncharacterized protein n=1 Tax=Brachionus calyciflorus TaxID=104777 RepID=A0A813PEG3_9BILA|nr:unnamed protein product [Brachionus calyciflorus]